jgi:hypothetical protein
MQYSRGENGLQEEESPEGGQNAVREAPGDEPGSSLLEGKTLKGRNPMSVSGTKQDRGMR